MQRILGKSGIKVSALGLGCWPIGGAWGDEEGNHYGYGETDDRESIAALHAAVEHGINFFDTAVAYGVGHSERLIGQAFKGMRDKVVLATKFCNTIDEDRKLITGDDLSPAGIRQSCEDSLMRMQTDYLDLFLLHSWGHPAEEAEPIRATLDELVKEGKIRSYGWSTDLLESIKAFNKNQNNSSAEVAFNVFEGNTDLLKYLEEENIAALARSPLAMGILSEKYDKDSTITGKDIRTGDVEWMTYFKKGKASKEYLDRLEGAKEILKSHGRSLVQGAIAWLWGKSDMLIPIPGFKSVAQAVENAQAMDFGPLTKDQVAQVEELVNFTKMFS